MTVLNLVLSVLFASSSRDSGVQETRYPKDLKAFRKRTKFKFHVSALALSTLVIAELFSI